jgi:hypothetical protein
MAPMGGHRSAASSSGPRPWLSAWTCWIPVALRQRTGLRRGRPRLGINSRARSIEVDRQLIALVMVIVRSPSAAAARLPHPVVTRQIQPNDQSPPWWLLTDQVIVVAPHRLAGGMLFSRREGSASSVMGEGIGILPVPRHRSAVLLHLNDTCCSGTRRDRGDRSDDAQIGGYFDRLALSARCAAEQGGLRGGEREPTETSGTSRRRGAPRGGPVGRRPGHGTRVMHRDCTRIGHPTVGTTTCLRRKSPATSSRRHSPPLHRSQRCSAPDAVIYIRRAGSSPRSNGRRRGPPGIPVAAQATYLAGSSVFTVIRLLPVSDTAKDVEILALRHQLAIPQRQIDTPRLTGTDRWSLDWRC